MLQCISNPNIGQTASQPKTIGQTASKSTNIGQTASLPTNIGQTASQPTNSGQTVSQPKRLISLYIFTFLVYCTIHYLQRDKQTEFIFIPNIQIHITQLSQVCMYLPNNNVWKKVVNLNCNKNMYIFSRFHIITFPLEVDRSGTTSLILILKQVTCNSKMR